MQEKQATGIDTWAMLPVYGSIFVGVCGLFLPWFSLPVLEYSQLPTAYGIWKFSNCVQNVQACIAGGGKLRMQPLARADLVFLERAGGLLQGGTAAVLLLMCISVLLVFRKRHRAAGFVRFAFGCAAALSLFVFLAVGAGNLFLNARMGRTSNFINLTIHSYLQMTSWMYAQFLVSVLLALFSGKLLDTRAEAACQTYIDRSQKKDRRMGKRTFTALLLIVFAIPFMIFFGIFFLNDRSNNFIALCIIGLSMVPFGMVFEDRRPEAREILLITVMSAIAVVGRMAFFMIPQFKPVTAIVIIAGVGLGAEAGFLTGALSGFVSNFFFGQGPWTPWQMFAFGVIGFLAGLLFHKSGLRKTGAKGERTHVFLLCVYGGAATLFIYGFLLDAASVLIFVSDFSWEAFLANFATGFPFNVIHGVSTVIFLFFLAVPMERKLDRIKKKYGILEA